MAEGTEIAKGYISVTPEINKAAFTAGGGIAGQAFSSAYTSEVRKSVASLQDSLRHEMAVSSGLARELGTSMGKNLALGIKTQMSQQDSYDTTGFVSKLATNMKQKISEHIPQAMQEFGKSVNNGLNSLQNTGFSVLSNSGRAAAASIGESMDNASAAISRLARTIGITAFNMQLLGGALTRYLTAPATLAVGIMDKVGLSMATTIENATISLKAFLPVGTDVDSLIKRLTAESIASPVFDLGQILNFTKGLIGAGMELSKAEKEVAALDKIFTTFNVTGAAVDDMLLGFSQVQSKGVAQSEELTKQIGQQIPIWSLLEKVTGQSQAKLREMVKAKDISGDAFADLVIKMGELDSIQRGAAEGANSLSAQWAMLKENMATALGIGFLANFPAIKAALADLQPLLADIIAKFTDGLPKMITHLANFIKHLKDMKAAYDSLTPEQRDMINKILLGLVSAGPALLALGQLTSGIGALVQVVALLSSPAVLIGGGIALALVGLGLAFADAYKHSADFRHEWDNFTEAVRSGWKEKIEPAFEDLGKAIDKLITSLDKLMNSLFGKDVSGKAIGEGLVNTIKFLTEGVTTGVDTLANAVDKLASLADKVKDLNQKAIDQYKKRVGQPEKQGEGAGQVAPAPDEGYWKQWWDNFNPIHAFTALGVLEDQFDAWTHKMGDKFDGWIKGWDLDGKIRDAVKGFNLWQAQLDLDGALQRIAEKVGSWAYNTWKGGWDAVFGVFGDVWNRIGAMGTVAMQELQRLINVFLQTIQEMWRTAWNWITDRFTTAKDTILGTAESLKNNFIGAINGLADGVQNAFERIRGIAARPVNFLINTVYTGGLKRLVDSVAGVLGLGIKLPDVTGIPGYAAGGQIPGHPSNRDNQLAMVATGEYIMPTDKTARYYPILEAMRSGAFQGYEGGGIVGGIANAFNWIGGKAKDFAAGTVMKTIDPLINTIRDALGGMGGGAIGQLASGAGTGLLNEIINKIRGKDVAPYNSGEATGGSLGSGGSSVDRLIRMVSDAHLNYTVNSSYRPGANDYHGSGRAVDFGGNMSGIAKFFLQYAPSLLELIHGDSGSFVKNGRRVGADFYGAATVAQHSSWGNNEHVHVAMNGDAQLGVMGVGGGNVGGSVGDWIREASKYVSIEWMEGLNTLIMRESGGNPRAVNNWDINAINGDPSGGLMQTIGATFRAYRDGRLPNNMFDPVANIVAGMNYIHSQYGSLVNVQQAHSELAPMGYARGVRSAPKGRAWVGENGPELMNFNGGESVTPVNMDGGPKEIFLNLDLGEGISERVQISIDKNNNATVSQLRKGAGGR